MQRELAPRAGTSGVEFLGAGAVPSAYAVTDFAAAAVAVAGLSIVRLLEAAGHEPPALTVDRTLAAAWFEGSLRPEGWQPPPAWDVLAGDYETADGWVRLHTNAPHHRDAALRALGVPAERDTVAAAVRRLRAEHVESVVVEAGGCAAALHCVEEWEEHPQGLAAGAEPLVALERAAASPAPSGWFPEPGRPLAGIRVLDLTRVLAGPVATRILAGYGAEVLRIDPPAWDEAVVPETTLGKRCARLDARSRRGQATLKQLLAQADVLVHGYRPGALGRLGLGVHERESIAPGLVDVSLDAYGWSGPWSGRRGFDSLVQMSTGIADAGRRWAESGRPVPLPFQALDQATGYLMAAAAIHGLTQRLVRGSGLRARCSLARTAHLLVTEASGEAIEPALDLAGAPVSDEPELTPWGQARRVRPPLAIAGAPLHWDLPATTLGSSPPLWR